MMCGPRQEHPMLNSTISRQYPLRYFLMDGQEFFRHVGYFPEEELVKVLQQKGVK